MKTKTLIFLLGLLLSTTGLFAQGFWVTISGTVTSQQAGDPVANHEVMATSFDSTFAMTYNVLTDSNGFYEMTLLVSSPNMISILVTTYDQCNPAIDYSAFVNTQVATNVNFEICTSASTTCTSSFIMSTGNTAQNEILFTNTSPGNVVSTVWDFGDGTQSFDPNPSHSYATPGVYLICLTIETVDSCIATSCEQIYAGPLGSCDANFLPITQPGTTNVVFLDLSFSVGNIISYSWDFGDGNTGTGVDPIHTYADTGSYFVCLTITTDDSCTSTYCEGVVVGGQSNYCTADFDYLPLTPGQNPLMITFEDYSFGNVISWSWDFGDGNTSTLQNPTHLYAAPGIYDVCLSILTSDSCTSTACYPVMVDTMNTTDCMALFYAYPDSMSNAVSFDELSWSASPIISFFWDFGDGNTSTQQYPFHTYAASGLYDVCLTIVTLDSCTSSICLPVHVGNVVPNCVASYNYTATSNPLEISFTDLSAGTVVEWFWDFGDGDFSLVANPTHTFDNAGTYFVCLSILTADSCVSDFCDFVTVTGNSTSNSIAGEVMAGNSLVSSGAVVLMSSNGFTFVEDIVNGSYAFTGLPDGTYIAYALASSFLYPTYTPTYHDSALFWTDAIELVLSGTNLSGVDIHLNELGGTANGTGSIGGSITFANNSKTYRNTFQAETGNIQFYIMDMDDNLLFHTQSTESNTFEFNNLPFGTYQLYIELAGHTAYPAIFTLSESMPTINDIVIQVGVDGISILNSDVFESIDFQLSVYPNPVQNELNVVLSAEGANTYTLGIYNAFGQLVQSRFLSNMGGTTNTRLDVSSFSQGVYFLRLEHPVLGVQSVRFMK